jgi:cytochrome b
VPHSAEGHSLSGFHAAVGIAVLATNLVAAVWGAIGWARRDARASIVFWPLLRAAQATVVVQVVLGLLLVARGASAPDGLHIVYGISPLVVSLVSEGMRAAVAQRELEDVEDVDALERAEQVALAKRVALGEMGVMTVGALLILTLALRAYQTGG